MKQANDKVKLTGFTIHPAAMELPELSVTEFTELKTDIKARGLIVPILKRGHVILDGRHRLRACQELGIEPRFVEHDGGDEIGDIFVRNVLRRHLTPDQRVALIAKFRGRVLSEEAQARKHLGRPNLGLNSTQGSGRVHQLLSAQAKVSDHKARQALATRKHSTALLDEVIDGKIELKNAAAIARQLKAAVKKPKPTKTLRQVVCERFQRFMDYWSIDQHREIKNILRSML
jgi:ParB-like chromosome segregation protein Spo0J